MDTIDLNADVGELDPGLDAAILQVVSSVNIACGGHAGDATSMRRVATAAAERGVRIGAHPSYVDRAGFGRTRQDVAPELLRAQIRDQILALAEFADITYVKPHGALYHAAATDDVVAQVLLQAVAEAEQHTGPLALMGQPGARYLRARACITEGFADRAYRPDGTLLPRTEPGSVLSDHDAVLAQVTGLARGEVISHDGQVVSVRADSVCVHSDTPGAARLARLIRQHLTDSGIAVTA